MLHLNPVPQACEQHKNRFSAAVVPTWRVTGTHKFWVLGAISSQLYSRIAVEGLHVAVPGLAIGREHLLKFGHRVSCRSEGVVGAIAVGSTTCSSSNREIGIVTVQIARAHAVVVNFLAVFLVGAALSHAALADAIFARTIVTVGIRLASSAGDAAEETATARLLNTLRIDGSSAISLIALSVGRG